MPVVQVSYAPTRELYEAVQSRLDMAGNRPDGLILHSAAETASGAVEIVDVYESAEHIDAYVRDRLLPTFQAAGVMETVTAQPPPVAYEPFDYIA
jgi:hypothetical protein